ncbi:MAG: GNAT family N-acetyltransferase [Gammaproteobacteria bacterium]|nr:GNAT family N-acetyltransferase [Gammaproteobacteria bacterium]
MEIDKKHLEYLSFLHLDPQQEKLSENFGACKNESMLPSTNRAFFQNRITIDDIQQLKQFYENKPFTIWLNNTNSEGNKDAEHLGFEKRYSYPFMLANLKNIGLCQENPLIRVDQITSKNSIINFWSDLVSTAYNISSTEFKKFVTYLVSVKKFHGIKFYVGYFNHSPAATSMFIEKDDTVDIHWVGTLPEFRNKGLGQAVTVLPLQKIKTIHKIKVAILYASAMGEPLYEKIGFSGVGECHVYGIKNPDQK